MHVYGQETKKDAKGGQGEGQICFLLVLLLHYLCYKQTSTPFSFSLKKELIPVTIMSLSTLHEKISSQILQLADHITRGHRQNSQQASRG